MVLGIFFFNVVFMRQLQSVIDIILDIFMESCTDNKYKQQCILLTK